MADDGPGRKRTRSSAGGCAHEGNDALVEELRKVRARLRESSHLASNFGRAIASVQAHGERISDGRQAKQLRNVGNYMANQIQAILNRQRGGASTSSATAAATAIPRTREAETGCDPPRRKKQQATQPSEPAFPSLAVGTEAGAGSSSREKMYAPSQGKRTAWLMVTKEAIDC